jgi:hypothetical protein
MRTVCVAAICFLLLQLVNGQPCPVVPNYPQINKLANSGPASSNKDWVSTDSSNNIYNWNFCGNQNTYSSCGLPNTAVCQNGATNAKSVGVITQQTITPGLNSVSFFYDQGSPSSSCTLPRRANITVNCDPKGTTRVIGLVAEAPPQPPSTSPTCLYFITMSSPYACPAVPYKPPTNLTLDEQQSNALTAIQSVWGDQLDWTGQSSTNGCAWQGVTCTSIEVGGQTVEVVIELDLSQQNLTGPLPTSLGDLPYLTHLDLSDNNFTGSSLPDALCGASQLSHLRISSSGLVGKIPSCFATILNLVSLHLGHNNLIGPVPPFNSTSSLQSLHLSYNAMSGPLPDGFAHLKYIEELFLSHNDFEGPAPGFVCALKDYNLQFNSWSCPLPRCCDDSRNALCVPCFVSS